jgi:hypothetical protein
MLSRSETGAVSECSHLGAFNPGTVDVTLSVGLFSAHNVAEGSIQRTVRAGELVRVNSPSFRRSTPHRTARSSGSRSRSRAPSTCSATGSTAPATRSRCGPSRGSSAFDRGAERCAARPLSQRGRFFSLRGLTKHGRMPILLGSKARSSDRAQTRTHTPPAGHNDLPQLSHLSNLPEAPTLHPTEPGRQRVDPCPVRGRGASSVTLASRRRDFSEPLARVYRVRG